MKNKTNNEYTGAFESKEAARKYFEEQGLSRKDQECIDGELDKFQPPPVNKDNANTNTVLNGSVNGTCKFEKKFEKSQKKVLEEIELCDSKTEPEKIESLLSSYFSNQVSQDGHWLYIAENYTPRAIARVLRHMQKPYVRRDIRNPAGYFTYAIKFRKKRKYFTGSIGT